MLDYVQDRCCGAVFVSVHRLGPDRVAGPGDQVCGPTRRLWDKDQVCGPTRRQRDRDQVCGPTRRLWERDPVCGTGTKSEDRHEGCGTGTRSADLRDSTHVDLLWESVSEIMMAVSGSIYQIGREPAGEKI